MGTKEKGGAEAMRESAVFAARVPIEIFDALPDPVAILRDGVLVWVNASFARLLGRTPDAMLASSLLAWIDEADHLALVERMSAGPDAPDTLRVTMRAGDTAPAVAVDLRLMPADPDGRTWLLRAHDVTEVARVEATIAQLGQLYVSENGRAMADTGALLLASEPVFRALGWTVVLYEIGPEGALLRHFLAPPGADGPVWSFGQGLLGKVFPLAILASVDRCIRTRRGFFDEEAALTIAGNRYPGLPPELHPDEIAQLVAAAGLQRAVWAPVLVQDKVQYVLGALGMRLTERDFAAVQLFAAQLGASVLLRDLNEVMARQERLAALGQMSTLVAHEVRNPLAVIFQVQRELRRRVVSSDEIRDLLDMLEEEARRLNELVDDLVHFAGPSRPRLQSVSLAEIVHCSVGGAREVAPSRAANAHLEIDIPATTPMVIADPLLLRQVFTHLLTNAFEHVKLDGRIEVSVTVQENGVEVRVYNDGDPLPEEVAGRVFEPFFTTKAVGSGLGLAVVRRLVEDQGGDVVLEQLPKGVAFVLRFPQAPSEP